jgi:ribonuclease P protein component
MRRSTEFSLVVRSGRRARRGSLVVHQLTAVSPPAPDAATAVPDRGVVNPGVVGAGGVDVSSREPIVGLIVGKSVGGSVVRHRVSRRLRAELTQRLDRFPAGSAVVVRALPEAGRADSATLGADLDAALAQLVGRPQPASRSQPAGRG